MKLYVNEKVFSFHDKFYVTDENGNNVYEIASKFISLGKKTTVYDMDGNKIIYIEQELFHITPHYNIYIDGNFEFQIAKKFRIFTNDYSLSNDYSVDGSFMMLDFSIYDNNSNMIGSIKRKFFSIGDKYEIEIMDESKKNIVLAIIVAISNDVNNSQSSSN